MIEQGQALRAEKSTLSALERGSWTKNNKIQLLSIVVFALSKQFYDPQTFAESTTGRSLVLLSEDRSIQAGIEELIRLHRPKIIGQASFGWWAREGDEFEDPQHGVWPRDGFRKLARKLGDWYRQYGEKSRAESYYRLAAELVPSEPDPQAYLQLADLYIAGNRAEDLEEMIEKNEENLFGGKASAYRESHVQKIYAYHRALGIIYANIERWGDRRTPASAIFQLTHAVKVADSANRRSPESKKAPIRVEPRMITYLASGYEAKSMPRTAVKIRLDAADRYLKLNDPGGAHEVLKPLPLKPPTNLSNREKARYKDLLKWTRESNRSTMGPPLRLKVLDHN